MVVNFLLDEEIERRVNMKMAAISAPQLARHTDRRTPSKLLTAPVEL